MSHRLLRASAATITLAAIAVGVPAALATSGRWPIRGLPTADQLRDLPTTLVSDTAVFAILTVAAWVVWALFMMSIVIEAKAELTGREPAARLIPALIRRPASILVAAMLMTVSVLGSSQRASAVPLTTPLDEPELSSTAAEATRPLSASPPAAATPEAGTLPEIEVRRGDNPWDRATTHLGDPMRWRELWELNRGVPQADGMAWTVPDVIEAGWRLRLPADARVPTLDAQSTYTVLPGDTLSEIALDHLGSVERFPEIFERNVGRPQPDGETLTDPDHIEPGWQLEVADPVPTEPELVPPVATDVPPPPTSVPEAPVTAPPATTPQSTTATSASPSPTSTPTSTSTDDGSRQLPVGLIAGGTATAGLLVLLERRRRAALRRRAAGAQPAPLRPDLDTAERELRTGAAPGRSTHVDAALRAIAGTDREALSAVRMVLVDDDHGRIDLDEDREAPEGFRSVDTRTWETAAPVAVLDELGASQPAPLPALCAIGTATDGTELLIDLERDPVTLIEAPDEVRTEMLNSVAAAALTAPWSTHPRVLCVGLSDCAGLGTESQATLTDALAEATSTRAESESDVLQLRLAEPESWEPTIVLSAVHPNAADAATLDALCRRGRSAVAVVCPPHPGIASARRVQVTPDGEIAIDDSKREASPSRLSDGDLGRIEDLLVSATSFVEPEPAIFHLPDERTGPKPISLELLRAELDVVVNVLGEVEAMRLSPGGDDDRITVAKQRALEAIAYIALRQSSVDREDVQAALWPDGANSAKTFSNAIWEARRVLGSDAHGADLLPDATEGRYTMSDRVGTDYGLFCDLVAGAAEVDPELSAALLTEALGLVRGEPFVGVGRSYAWVGPHRGMSAAQVLDAAERLAEVQLANGDWRGAEWAARQGLRALPCDERMYRLLMRAAHHAGNTAGVHRAFRELCDAVADPDTGAEPDDTVHPETVALLEQLTRTPARRVTA